MKLKNLLAPTQQSLYEWTAYERMHGVVMDHLSTFDISIHVLVCLQCTDTDLNV